MIVRKSLTVLTVSIILSRVALFAAEPGGTVGLAKAIFTGSSFDTTSDVMASAVGYVPVPEEMYATSLPEKTTVAWAGYMKMEKGVAYDFKGCYDDYVSVKINGTWVLSKGSECQERTGAYVPNATDWHSIEFRVANNGGGGGCQRTSQYGILWKKRTDSDWRKVSPYDGKGILIFKTGRNDLPPVFKTTPIVLSSKMRGNDPTVMDVTYIVYSPSDTVNVRALAFEDGERSFWKVVRPETFVKDLDGNETAQNIGDNIAVNVEHKLAWKIDSDWNTDLANVKFEILVSEIAQLPLKAITIPATAKNQEMVIAYNEYRDADVFNALLWWYADGAIDLINDNGYVDVNQRYNQYDATPHRFVNRTEINNRMEPIRYLLKKMGWEPLEGGNLLTYVRKALRKDVAYNSAQQNAALLTSSKPEHLYIGEKAYCVIDVSVGTNAVSYGISYLDCEPVAGWTAEYKSQKIVLRRCGAGSFLMQGNRNVTLTKPFYMSVFPITQRQYELVVGSKPTYVTGTYYPAVVSWDTIRGDNSWPNSNNVGENSFMGILRKKTGLAWDLPTEAQFEYAYLAGLSRGYPNGGTTLADFSLTGYMAYSGNVYMSSIASSQSSPYAPRKPVGFYLPNYWGLYDMCGNVGQWCLDRYGELSADPVVDPVGSTSGLNRVLRGFERVGVARFGGDAFYRYAAPPDQYWEYTDSVGIYTRYGFRLCLTIE